MAKSTSIKHGTVTGYRHHKCRCGPCSEAARQSSAKWRSENQEKVKAYRKVYYADNRETILEKTAAWRDDNRQHTRDYASQYRNDNPEAALEATRKWRENNPDKVQQYQQEYNKNNRNSLQDYQRTYRRENPEFHRAANHRRRAREKDAFVEDVDRVAVFERDGWICQGCGIECPKDAVWPAKNFPTLEHIIPISKGGEHSYANTELLCLSCNSSKKDKQLERPVKNV